MQRADSSIEQLSSKIAAVTEAQEAQSQFSKIRNLPDLFSLDSRFSGTGQASRHISLGHSETRRRLLQR